MRPSLCRARWLLLLLAALVLPAVGEELHSRVFWVGPDFSQRGIPAPEPGAAPDDPFAGEAGAQRQAPARVLPRFPHVIPALGPQPPEDVRTVLESLGVTFGEKALALLSNPGVPGGTYLYVRNTFDQLDLIDTIVSGMGPEYARHLRLTFRWEERFPSGRTRLLLERTLICRSGQRARFQRHRDGTLLEEIEIEVVLGEDGRTVEANTACDLTSGKLRACTQVIALLTAGDPAPQRLATARGTRPGSTTELSVRAERCALIPTASGEPLPLFSYTELTRLITQQLAAAEQQPAAPDKAGDLFWAPGLAGFDDQQKLSIPALADLQSADWLNARAALTERGIPLEAADRAWVAPQSGLLYLHAGQKARQAATLQFGASLPPTTLLVEASFDLAQERRGQSHPLTRRSLLIRSGQRAGLKHPIQGAPDEDLEAEADLFHDDGLVDLNMALTHIPAGRDTWTFLGQTYSALDGQSSIPLISGRSADTGGALRTLSLRTAPPLNPWRTLLSDPAKKAGALSRIEAALPAR